jgi:hypothetical protein
MRVTLDVFSGRPNPTWRLTPREARELIDRAAAGGASPPADPAPVLGFRGFAALPDPEDQVARAGLPLRFDVARLPAAAAPAPFAAARERAAFAAGALDPAAFAPGPAAPSAPEADTADWLLETARGTVEDHVLDLVRASVRGGARAEARAEARATRGHEEEGRILAVDREELRAGPAAARAPRDEAAAPENLFAGETCQPFLTPMAPLFWDYQPIRLTNNCYNYATNFVSYTLAQPGRFSGHLYTAFTCDAVLQAAMSDGILTQCDGSVRVVALGIWPDTDFHWWRLHPDGFWAHKIGWNPWTNRDNLGRIIGFGLTPATCDRGVYTTFCGYYYVPLGVQVV